MIRQGNHFVRVGDQWMLVEGPWFDDLERIYADRGVRGGAIGVHVLIEPLQILVRPIFEQDLPEMVTYVGRFWYPVVLSWTTSKTLRALFREITRALFEGDEVLRGVLSQPYSLTEVHQIYWLEERWDAYLYKYRRKRVWRFEDGGVPADFAYTADDYCRRYGLEKEGG